MKTPNLAPGRTPARLAVLLATLVLVAGCAGAAAPRLDTVGSGVGGAPMPAATAAPAPADMSSSAIGGAVDNGTGGQVLDAARPDLLIIKTGSLDLQVKDLAGALTTAATKITALGGYVSGSAQSGDGENVTASVTYRIPAAQWETALAALRGLAIKVVAENTQTQDVTGQVVDLGARITNLQVTERALQAIMDRATKITDVLAVQTELTRVRGDIEQAVAEKTNLQGQAAFSTLTVGFTLKPEPAVVISQQKFDPASEVDRAAATLVDVLQGLATAGIWFAIVWLPILFVLGLIGFLAWLAARRRFGRGAGAAVASGASASGSSAAISSTGSTLPATPPDDDPGAPSGE